MSYLVLARKYRPRSFTEMVGQEHVVQALGNALTQQRLHHAYLFTGTRGVGKTTVSRILAKSLNCQGPDGQGGITATPCGVCAACTDIDTGRFVDYTELDAASNRGVDEVQTLLEQAVYKPVQGRYKVFMIDEVHMLTQHAFNAMLKTLEEPPEYLKFVLATTDPQKVPVTVLSRCLQFNLRPMDGKTLMSHLVHVLQSEAVPFETPALRLIARAARGSMRDALSLTDQSIAYGSGQVTHEAVRQMLGSVDTLYAIRLVEALARGDAADVVAQCDALRRMGLSAAATLEEMAGVLQRMAVRQMLAPQAAAELDEDDAHADAEIARLAPQMPADETQLLYSLCLHGRAELGLAPDEHAGLVMVLLRLLAFKPAGALAAASDSAARVHQSPAEKKTLAPESTAAELAQAGPVRALPPELSAKPSGNSTAELPADGARVKAGDGRIEVAHSTASIVASAASPSGLLSMPLRVQSEPSERTEVRRLDLGPSEAAWSSSGSPAAVAEGVDTHDGRLDADFWHATVCSLVDAQAVSALARELALQSQLVGRDDGHWQLRVERESLNQSGSRERLQSALAAAGHDVRLTVEVGLVGDSPAKRMAAAAAERQRQAEAELLDDPFVQRMMRDFGARIVPGSVKPNP